MDRMDVVVIVAFKHMDRIRLFVDSIVNTIQVIEENATFVSSRHGVYPSRKEPLRSMSTSSSGKSIFTWRRDAYMGPFSSVVPFSS